MPIPQYWVDTTWQNWTTTSTTTWVDQTWKYWITTFDTTTTANYVYESWVSNSATVTPAQLRRVLRTYEPPRETSEQRSARVAEFDRRQAEERARRLVAYTKARVLLMESLTDEQRREFITNNRFHVVTRAGRRYRIDCGRAHNVFRVNDEGLAVVEFCAHVRDAVPDEDNILAQKLLLEHNEDEFLNIANQRQLIRS